MTSIGTVINVQNGCATVRVICKSACGHDCGECKACDAPSIDSVLNNSINAKVGDTVEISSPSKNILTMAFLLYMLPLVLTFIIYAISNYVFNNVIINALFCVAAIGAWIITIKHFNNNKVEKSKIVRIVKK